MFAAYGTLSPGWTLKLPNFPVSADSAQKRQWMKSVLAQVRYTELPTHARSIVRHFLWARTGCSRISAYFVALSVRPLRVSKVSRRRTMLLTVMFLQLVFIRSAIDTNYVNIPASITRFQHVYDTARGQVRMLPSVIANSRVLGKTAAASVR